MTRTYTTPSGSTWKLYADMLEQPQDSAEPAPADAA